MDHILVYTKSPDFSERLQVLRKVFQRFREFTLKLSPKKCAFALRTINFYGHTIYKRGYTPGLAELDTIRNFPRPINAQQSRRFIDLAGLYRRFVLGFAKISAPLTELTKKNCRFHWNKEQSALT